MIEPDDPRHGSYAGYVAGCRCTPCKRGNRIYHQQRLLDLTAGKPRTVPATGFTRRVHALQAIGWTLDAIAARTGISRTDLWHATRHNQRVTVASHDRLARVYNELSMKPGPSNRVRALARGKGWVLPLRWDDAGEHDIDDPNAEPYRPPVHKKDGLIDEVIVTRALNGQRVPDATVAERFEIVRRWQRDGRALNELERIQHWHARRYTGEMAA